MFYSDAVATAAIVISIISPLFYHIWDKRHATKAEIDRYIEIDREFMDKVALSISGPKDVEYYAILYTLNLKRLLELDRICKRYLSRSISRKVFKETIADEVIRICEKKRASNCDPKFELVMIDPYKSKTNFVNITTVYSKLKRE